ncbi:MAG TPA: HDOD domain-containing protein [Acidimicrobiia bacterium]|nr:HDOD domain-containing protein [Acidimicrobiia bacterium]
MKRVLVVDDESRVVDAMHRTLRSERRWWSVTTATTGDDAVAQLDDEPFDAIVTDMLMPGMDGAELLAIARERRPETLRIVLSGHTDRDLALRALPVAHQFRSKPCNGADLKSTIGRGLMFHDLVVDASLRRGVGRIAALPTPAHTADALVALLDGPAPTTDAIAAALVEDVAATAKLLQIVNSSFFGLPGGGRADVRTAVRYLGVEALRAIFLGEGLLVRADGPGLDETTLTRVARRSLVVATLARELVSDPTSAHAAFAAGLMLDVGRLVVASDETTSTARDDDDEVLGATLNQIGASLLAMWGLPQPIVEAVARQHMAPLIAGGDEIPVIEITDAVYLADTLVRRLDGDAPLPHEADDPLDAFGLGARTAELETLAARTAASLDRRVA